jgi:hypoxanthine phosphoribosyltransferase
MTIHDDIERILIDDVALKARVAALGEQISRDYAGQSVVLVGILKGAVLFLADIARELTVPVALDFMAVSSYGNQTETSGVVRILKDLDDPINGKHVLLVEDIIDSGLTISYVLELLRRRNPASVRVCTLLDKTKAKQKYVQPDYTGFPVPDEFVVGYGLDYAQNYRNLPYIGVLKSEIYQAAK